MSISTLQTIQSRSKPKLSNILIYASAVLVAFILIFFGQKIFVYLKSLGGKSALRIDVASSRAEIYLNDQMLGVTPFDSKDIKPGNNKITIKATGRQYETTINFLSNNDKYIHIVDIFRDLGISDLFSSGQDVWFDENTSGNVLRVISDPNGASVYLDNTEIGKTPYTSSRLTEGNYDLRIEHPGYEAQTARIRIQKGYTSNISVKLFPMPVADRVVTLEGSQDLFNLVSTNNLITSDTATWAKAAVYWNQTRGINLEGTGLNKEAVFDYFVDYKGGIYDELGDPLSPENYEKLKDAKRGAYLGRSSDGAGITETAKNALAGVKGIKTTQLEKTAKVLQTGTGWLRVRSEPNINGREIAKVNVGNSYPILEEQTEWIKIMAENNVEGWVSKTFVQISDKVNENLSGTAGNQSGPASQNAPGTSSGSTTPAAPSTNTTPSADTGPGTSVLSTP